MAELITYLPQVEGLEAMYLQEIFNGFTEEEAGRFTSIYQVRRKDPQTILITCLVGFLGFAGIHRLILGQIGMGIIYLLTAGLCFIGTIIDLVNYKQMTFEANKLVIQEIMGLYMGKNKAQNTTA